MKILIATMVLKRKKKVEKYWSTWNPREIPIFLEVAQLAVSKNHAWSFNSLPRPRPPPPPGIAGVPYDQAL